MNRSRMFARLPSRTPIFAEMPGAVGTTAVLRLYDPIDSWGGEWGVSAKEFAAALDALPDSVNAIELHINSPGGEVWEGLAILNSLRQHPANVTTIVDGIAASAASFVALGGDQVLMAQNAELFIHDAWGFAMGNATDMQKMADELNHESDNLARIYAAKAGGTVEDWRMVMQAETWFSDQEAVDAGLADQVVAPYSGPGDVSQLKNRYDLSIFNQATRGAKAPKPKTPAAKAVGQPSKKGTATMATFLEDVRQKLGVADANADEAAVLAALDEVLAEQAEEPTGPQASLRVPEGQVLVSKAKLDEDRKSYDALASQVRELLDDKAQARREGKVKAAIRDGKIMPAEKQAYMNALSMDEEGTTKRLDDLAPGLVPFAEKGYDGGPGVDEADPNQKPGWADKHFGKAAS